MADSPLDPDAIARKTFLAGFRGYEQQEVRAYLHDLAQQARRVQSRLVDTERRLSELEPLADEIDAPIDPSRLAQLVGEETTRVLEAARSAADEITSKAEEAAARVIRDATAEAQTARQAADDDARLVRDEADQMLARKTNEADEAAEEIIGRAERDAATKREDADADHARAVADAERLTADSTEQAERIVAEAKAHGRSIVAEAKALRQKVLEDLGRRRQVARAQVARLNAGRERLLSAYETVRSSLDEATGELTNSVGEARAAADTAALRIQDEETPTVEDLEAELGIATDADLLEWDDDDDVGDDEADAAGGASDAPLRSVEPNEPASDDVSAAPSEAGGPSVVTASTSPVVTSAELPEVDADLEAEPVEDPPDPIVLPRKSPKRRLLRRDADSPSTMLPPAELVPLTERHQVEGVRLVTPEPAAPEVVDVPAETVADISAAPDGGGVATDDDIPPVATAERVDELFARIRAERADTVESATEAPDDADPGPDESDPIIVVEGAKDTVADDTDAEAEVVDEPSEGERIVLEAMSERDEAIGPLAKELSKRLKRALADEQNELLDSIRRGGDDDVLSHLPDARAHASVYITASGPILGEAAAAAMSDSETGEPPNTEAIARKMAEAISTPLRDRFEHAREEAAGDADELDTRLRACYREWKTTVLPDAGEDALVAAWSAGVLAATPGGCGLRWLVAPGSPPCPDADDNALAGIVDPGAEFPTGDLMPPAHPGCRCLVVHVPQ